MTVAFSPVLYTSLLRKEAMESSAIEGAAADYNAVYGAETRSLTAEATASETPDSEPDTAERDTKDAQEVLNYEDALLHGIDALDADEEITVELLHEMHDLLLADVPEDRRETDTVGSFKTTPNRAGTRLTPPPHRVGGLMDALITYIRTGGRYHPLVDTALVHYQFETIHPYGDGNGRIGRLLITLQLYEAGYLERPNLYLSEYFNRNKEAYVDRLEAVRDDGAWADWVTFFVRGVRQQARESVTRSLELRQLSQRYQEEYGNINYAYGRLASRLFETPYFSAPQVADMLDVERSTAYRAIERLQEEGLVEEVTGKERYQEFRAAEIFEILEQPPQTY
jgi:Uncharacterized conserved protein